MRPQIQPSGLSSPARKYLQTLNKVQGKHFQEPGESAEKNSLILGGGVARHWQLRIPLIGTSQGNMRDALIIAALISRFDSAGCSVLGSVPLTLACILRTETQTFVWLTHSGVPLVLR